MCDDMAAASLNVVDRVPIYILTPIIVVFCSVGAFAISSNMIDVYVMILFGVSGKHNLHLIFRAGTHMLKAGNIYFVA